MNISQVVVVFLVGIGVGVLFMRSTRPKYSPKVSPNAVHVSSFVTDSGFTDLSSAQTTSFSGEKPSQTLNPLSH